MQNKFKVGDVVEIVGALDGNNSKWNFTEGFDNDWVPLMNKYIGKTLVITKISPKGINLTDNDYRYPPQALKLMVEKEDTTFQEKKYRTVDTHYPTRIICKDRKDSKLTWVALYTTSSGDEGVVLVSAEGADGWGKKIIEEVPEIDWSKVKVDAPIWVKICSDYSRRHFAEFKYGYVYFYGDGLTSHTGSLILSVVEDYASLTNPNEKA